MKTITRTFDIISNSLEQYPKKKYVASKVNGKWITYSTQEFYDKVQYISSALFELGFRHGDKIATITNNRAEWNFLDMGMSQIGVIHVSIYPSIGTEEYDYILNHSEVEAVIVGSAPIYQKIESLVKNNSNIKHLYSITPIENINHLDEKLDETVESVKNLEHKFEKLEQTYKSDFEKLEQVYKSDFESLEQRYKSDFESLEQRYKSDFESLEHKFEKLEKEFEKLKEEIELTIQKALNKNMMMLIIVIGLFMTISKIIDKF
jgi:long-subunit acyl-CoA synthetase (AMP-forming)/tetrahydromethanopterin S-methyltransferase subunit G